MNICGVPYLWNASFMQSMQKLLPIGFDNIKQAPCVNVPRAKRILSGEMTFVQQARIHPVQLLPLPGVGSGALSGKTKLVKTTVPVSD
ncbi:MAG: hypothetical protein HGA81_04620 [Chlorobium limicola]|nr:hypothetical protein [Chlorobium limicola]